MSNEVELPNVVRREVNSAKILEEERNGASWWFISAYDHLRNEGGIVRGWFVEGGICEAVDKPESASESEEDPFADIDEQKSYCVTY